ncbi:MAG: hypothetical protein ACUVTZ_13640 [Armatimonadota bacterium]
MYLETSKPVCELCGAPAERFPAYLSAVSVAVRCQKCVLKRSPKVYEQTSTWPKHSEDPSETGDHE